METKANKEKKNKTTIIVALVLITLAVICFCMKDYIINIFNNKSGVDDQVNISLPEDYVEPTLSLKSEYSQGIIYENSESFNIKDYVDYTAYDNEASIWYELTNNTNNKSSINKVGQYPITINLKDKYDKTIKLETIIYTYNHLQNVLTNLQEGFYDGTWLSSEINDTHFQFEINYPKVCDSNGNTGEIVVSDNNTYDFSINFTQDDTSVEFRVSTKDNGSTLLWLPNEDGTFTTSLSFTRSNEEESTEVDDSNSKDTSSSNPTPNKKSGHYELKLVKEAYDETIPAYDETVVVKDAWTEKVLVKDAWDEECEFCTAIGYDKQYTYHCNQCGYETTSGDEICSHIRWSDGCGNYMMYDKDVGEQHCLSYETQTVHHDAEYDYIYHEAETKVVHHDAEVVHHEAQYKKVWVED